MAGTQTRARQTLPTQSIAKAAAAMRGKRSGVIINPKKAEKGKMEDMDEVFDSAKTPDKTTAALDEHETSSAKNSAIASARKSKRKVKRPTEARMSLPGVQEDDDESKNSAAKPGNYMNSVLAGSLHFSPSDLSHVSAAPRTPREETESEEEEEDVEETRAEPLTQQEEEHVVSQTAKATTPQHSPGMAAASPEAFPLDDDDEDDEEEDQDLLPPNPPEQEDDQESVVQSVEEEPVAFPNGDDNEDEEEAPEATAVAGHEMENDDDSGDDDEGAGYNMVHDPETPHSVRKERKRKEKEELEKKQKKGKRGRPRKSQDSEANTPVRASKKTKKRNVVFSPQGYPIGNRDYTEVPLSDLIEPSPSDPNLRRSRRARTSPLNFWKNERQVFGAHDEDGDIGDAMGDMPVVTKVLRALPTPYRKRAGNANGEGAKKSKRPGRSKTAASQQEECTPFDARKLRKKYNVIDGEMAQIWDAGADDIADMKVVSYSTAMVPSDLPVGKARRKSEGKATGKAAQAFNVKNDQQGNYCGYIMGNLALPPGGIKDAESVGPCSQTFTVCLGQPQALEVAYNDPDEPDGGDLNPKTAQRFLLGPGDLFRVPAGNCYRLENHSKESDCLLTWTIIKPRYLPSGGEP